MTKDYDEILARMQAEYRTLAGCEADDASDIGIRLKVLAGETARLTEQLIRLREEAFPQTAQGEALDRHAQQRGLTRKAAVKASGTLRFGRGSALGYDAPIPAGTVCAPAGGGEVRFVTTREAVLPAYGSWVEVPAEAEVGGKAGNAAAGRITVLVTPPEGILTVSNPLPFAGGADSEGDEELRARLLESYRNIANGTNAAFYREEALKRPGIGSVSVVPCENGAGTVSLYCAGVGGPPGEAVLQELQEALNNLREITVRVSVHPCETVPVAISVLLTVCRGYPADQVKANCEAAIRQFFERLAIGETVYLSSVGEALYHVDGVRAYYFDPSFHFNGAVTQKELAIPGKLVLSAQEEESEWMS